MDLFIAIHCPIELIKHTINPVWDNITKHAPFGVERSGGLF